jgi:hypothetical protein
MTSSNLAPSYKALEKKRLTSFFCLCTAISEKDILAVLASVALLRSPKSMYTYKLLVTSKQEGDKC